MKPSRLFLAPALAVLALHPAAAAQPGFGSWTGDEQAQVRLIAAGIGADGRLAAGIEIMLEPGWRTYWRTPGAAGIPPAIDFSGSANLGAVEVSFPLPERHDDGYGVSNVYAGRRAPADHGGRPRSRGAGRVAPVTRPRRLRGGLHSRACRGNADDPARHDRSRRRGDARRRPRAGPGSRRMPGVLCGRKRASEWWHRQAPGLRHRRDRARQRRDVRRRTGGLVSGRSRTHRRRRARRPTGSRSTASVRRRRSTAQTSVSRWSRTGRRSSRSSPSTSAGSVPSTQRRST